MFSKFKLRMLSNWQKGNPEYFWVTWRAKTGFDPFKRSLQGTMLYVSGLAIAFLAAAYYFAGSFVISLQVVPKWNFLALGTIAAGLLVTSYATFLIIGTKSTQYQDELDRVASYLGRTKKELGALTLEAITAIASPQLKELGQCVLAVESVIGSRPHPAKELLSNELKQKVQCYFFWGIIPSADLKPYLLLKDRK